MNGGSSHSSAGITGGNIAFCTQNNDQNQNQSLVIAGNQQQQLQQQQLKHLEKQSLHRWQQT